MYRGRTSIGEVLNLPNRVFNGLFHIRSNRLLSEEGRNEEASQLMEEELEGGI